MSSLDDMAADLPPSARIVTGSHDLPVSDALAEFMITGWAPEVAGPPDPHPAAAFTAARREALSARFPGDASSAHRRATALPLMPCSSANSALVI